MFKTIDFVKKQRFLAVFDPGKRAEKRANLSQISAKLVSAGEIFPFLRNYPIFVKKYEKSRISEVSRKIVFGTPEQVERILADSVASKLGSQQENQYFTY